MNEKASEAQIKNLKKKACELGYDTHDTLGEEINPTTNMLPKKKKRGRPKGSKNREAPVIDHPKPKCIKCGGTNLSHIRTISERVGEFTISGKTYAAIKLCQVMCECGQFQKVRYLG